MKNAFGIVINNMLSTHTRLRASCGSDEEELRRAGLQVSSQRRPQSGEARSLVCVESGGKNDRISLFFF